MKKIERDGASVRLQMRDAAVRHKQTLDQSRVAVQSLSLKMDALTFWQHLAPIKRNEIIK